MVERIRPLHDRVLVKRTESESVTKSGIIIPDAAKERAQIGKVVAVGKGRINQDGTILSPDVRIGDTVFFGKYSGVEADKEYLILKEDEILGVVNE